MLNAPIILKKLCQSKHVNGGVGGKVIFFLQHNTALSIRVCGLIEYANYYYYSFMFMQL